MAEAQLDVGSANDGIQVADAESHMYSTQITNLQEQIFSLQFQKLSLGDLVSPVGLGRSSPSRAPSPPSTILNRAS
jgi:hypothetical protein